MQHALRLERKLRLLKEYESGMSDTELQIDFDAAASLRKWPSLNKERLTETNYPEPYLLFDVSLDDCIKEFMAKPASQHHLYEIHTAPQQSLISAVLSAEHIIELARLREFLA